MPNTAASSDGDTHVALIVSGGAVPAKAQGKFLSQPVHTTQIAVSALNALGLDADALQGAVIEGTRGLPGLGAGLPGQPGEDDGQGDDHSGRESSAPVGDALTPLVRRHNGVLDDDGSIF
jgi:hypothetical protein